MLSDGQFLKEEQPIEYLSHNRSDHCKFIRNFLNHTFNTHNWIVGDSELFEENE